MRLEISPKVLPLYDLLGSPSSRASRGGVLSSYPKSTCLRIAFSPASISVLLIATLSLEAERKAERWADRWADFTPFVLALVQHTPSTWKATLTVDAITRAILCLSFSKSVVFDAFLRIHALPSYPA